MILHRSTKEEVPTRIGAGCYLMGHSHVGHDAQVGNGVILTQGVGVAGHVEIGDYAVIGGMAGIHQFVRVGSRAMIGGLAKVTRDVLPFSLADGSPALHYRLNTVGLRRAGITGERYRALEQAFRAVREGRPRGLARYRRGARAQSLFGLAFQASPRGLCAGRAGL